MDIKTFIACVRLLKPGISVLIKGDHGIGKSQLVRRIARDIATDMGVKPEDFPVVDRRLSQMSEGDMIGLPSQDGRTTTFLPMDWFMSCVEAPKLLFLDEGNRGSQEVLQASFQIALDRELNGHGLNANSRVFMAINADETKYQVNPLDPAFIDRWFVVDLEPSREEWLEWAKDFTPDGGCVHKFITDFLEISPLMMDPSGNEGPTEKDTSRRSWDRYSQAFTDNKMYDWDLKDEAKYNLIIAFSAGFLGKPAAAAFCDYLKNMERHLTAEDVLNEYDKNFTRIEALSQGEVNGVNNSLTEWMCNNTLTDTQAKNFGKWYEYHPAEISTGLWQQIAMHPGSTTVNIKLMHKYVAAATLRGVNAAAKTP